MSRGLSPGRSLSHPRAANPLGAEAALLCRVSPALSPGPGCRDWWHRHPQTISHGGVVPLRVLRQAWLSTKHKKRANVFTSQSSPTPLPPKPARAAQAAPQHPLGASLAPTPPQRLHSRGSNAASPPAPPRIKPRIYRSNRSS